MHPPLGPSDGHRHPVPWGTGGPLREPSQGLRVPTQPSHGGQPGKREQPAPRALGCRRASSGAIPPDLGPIARLGKYPLVVVFGGSGVPRGAPVCRTCFVAPVCPVWGSRMPIPVVLWWVLVSCPGRKNPYHPTPHADEPPWLEFECRLFLARGALADALLGLSCRVKTPGAGAIWTSCGRDASWLRYAPCGAPVCRFQCPRGPSSGLSMVPVPH